MTLTADQQRAVELRGLDLCVVAGAGTGKTHVLTERIVRRVREGLDLAQLLAITFTEKAAGQMRRRLRAALEADGRESAWEDVERAAISTVHAFCARLLREYAVEAGVDPGFAVIDEVQADALLAEAVAAFEAELAAGPEADVALLRGLPGADPAQTLVDILRAARESVHSVEHFVRFAAAEADGAVAVAPLEDALGEAVDAAVALAGGATAKGREIIEAVRVAWEQARHVDGDAGARLAAVHAVRSAVVLRTSEPVKSSLANVRDVADALLAALAEVLLAPVRAAVSRAVLRLEELYEHAKGDGQSLDFSDLERRAVGLLERDATVRTAARERWRDVLVDEFQDTNPVQSRLVEAVRPEHGGLFVVGDPKQAIYGFRGSDVSVFFDTCERVRRDDARGEVHLAQSFRARPEVLGVVNRLFEPGFAPEPGAPVEYEPLTAGRRFEPPAQPCVEVAAAQADDTETARRLEAAFVAERIGQLVEGDGVAAPLSISRHDADGNPVGGRPAEHGDVAILLRAMTHVKTFEHALTARGIPYLVVKGRGFYAAREVVDLANLLSCVDDPLDDLLAAAVLRSPVCGVSDDALFALTHARGASAAGRARPASLLGVVRAFGDDALPVPGLPPAEAPVLRSFAREFAALRRMRARAPLSEIVDVALDRTRLEVLALARANGRQRAANLRKVRALARARDAGGRGSLSDLVRDMRDLRAREVKETEAPVSAAAHGAVSIMTVHAAKGLEFPVVFVPDLGRQAAGARDAVAVHSREGLGLPLPVDLAERFDVVPQALARIRENDKLRERSENDRLFYVAVTRAAEHLVLSAALGSRDVARPWWDRVTGILQGAGEGVVDAGAPVRVHPARVPGGTASAGSGTRTLLFGAARALAEGGALPRIDVTPEARESATALIAEASRTPPPTSGALFTTTVSALVTLARDPGAFLRRHVFGLPDADDLFAKPLADAFGEEGHGPERFAPGDDDEFHVSPGAASRPADGGESGDVLLDARARGRAVHAALERLVPDFDADVRTAVRDALEVETAGAPPEPGDVALLTRWIEGFRGSDLCAAALSVPRDRLRREQAFLFSHGRTAVRGQIDLVFRGASGWVVVDYKASRFDAPGDDYALQMRLYALALEAVTGEVPARLALFSLPDARAVDVPCTREHLDELRTGLLAEFDRVTEGHANH